MKPQLHYLVLSDNTLDVRFEDGTSKIMTWTQLNSLRHTHDIISDAAAVPTKTKDQIQLESALLDIAEGKIKGRVTTKHEIELFTLTCAAPERYYKYYVRLKEELALYENLNLPRSSFKLAFMCLVDKWLKVDQNKIPQLFECPTQGGPTLGSNKFTSDELSRINDIMEKLNIQKFKHLVCALVDFEDYKIQDITRYAVLHRKELVR